MNLKDSKIKLKKLLKSLGENSELSLLDILNYSYDGLIITDDEGLVVYINKSAEEYMGIDLEEILNFNVNNLVAKDIYDKSIISDAINSKELETGIVEVQNGKNVVSTAKPILNSNDEVILTLTNVREENLLDRYAKKLKEKEKEMERYKSAITYINKLNGQKSDVIAESFEMKKILFELSQVSSTDSSILLTGETGTGKDVLAQFIHKNSNRFNNPFIPVNCSAIPEGLIESEFFGYAKGSFSGASESGKIGYFEMANKGTLFLDEIGEMPKSLQPKLLRVLETGKFHKIGSENFYETDVRIVAATNKDLQEMVKQGKFREDLYYRLNVIPIKIPPLRNRKDDIIPLVEYFIENSKNICNKKELLSNEIKSELKKYDWPGNVRELKNVVERLCVSKVSLSNILTNNNQKNKTTNPVFNSTRKTNGFDDLISNHDGDLVSLQKKVEEKYIIKVLADNRWKIGKTAEQLNIHRSTLYRKIQDYNIEV